MSQGFWQKMREQSEGERVRFASLMSLAVTFVVFVLWVVFILNHGKVDTAAVVQTSAVVEAPSVLDMLKKRVSNTLGDFVNIEAETKE